MGEMMIAPNGTYENPADKWCFEYCTSCGRCDAKGTRAACGGCSGRFDLKGQRVPDRDDYCRCKEGILQWITSKGRKIQVPLRSDPFNAVVKYEETGQDEADWDSYINDLREKYDNPTYDPISFNDGTSTTDYFKSKRNGL